MRNFMSEHDQWGLLENRLSQRNIKTFMVENPDVAPPVNIDREYKITVRRPTKAPTKTRGKNDE
jgi:hypothetical protein